MFSRLLLYCNKLAPFPDLDAVDVKQKRDGDESDTNEAQQGHAPGHAEIVELRELEKKFSWGILLTI